MSSTDERVVEMRFENAQFEKGIKESSKSLESFKNSLQFDDVGKNIKNLEKNVNSISFRTLEQAANSVSDRLSNFGIVGVTVLQRITNAAVDAGVSLANMMTSSARGGFAEYETLIGSIQTIMSNTRSKGTTLDDVNSALDELNRYADLTIYNFTQMTRNIGTFTAAGIDLETSTAAIKGIANLAAVSGSTSQQASVAMYQLSQALAAGTTKLMDWNSVVNAGMGGQVFQDAIMETARVHGVAIDDMIAKEGSFRNTLKDNWLTNEILLESLKKFTGDYTEEELRAIGYTEEQIRGIKDLGKDASDAATKVKTLSQLFETLSEAAGSGWTRTWQIIVGDFEEARDLFTSISDVLSGIINTMSDKRNNLLEAVFGKPKDIVITASKWKEFENAGLASEAFKNRIMAVAKEHNSAISSMMDAEITFEEFLTNGWITSGDVETVLDEAASIAGSKTFEEYQQVVSDIWAGRYGNGEDRVQALAEAGYDYAVAQGLVNKTIDDQTITWEELTDEERAYFEAAAAAAGAAEDQAESLDIDAEAARNLLENTEALSGREKIIQGFANIWQYLGTIVEQIKVSFRSIFPDNTESLLSGLIDKFYNFTETLGLSDRKLVDIRAAFFGLFSVVSMIVDIIGGVAKGFGDFFSELFSRKDKKNSGAFLKWLGDVGRALAIFRKKFKNADVAGKIAEKIKDSLFGMVEGLKAAVAWFKEFFGIEAQENTGSWFDGLIKWFQDIPNKIKEAGNNLFNGSGESIFSRLGTTIRDKIRAGLDKIQSGDFHPFKALREALENFLGVNFSDYDFSSVGAAIESIGSIFSTFVENAGWADKLQEIKDKIKEFYDGLVALFSGGYSTTETPEEPMVTIDEFGNEIATKTGGFSGTLQTASATLSTAADTLNKDFIGPVATAVEPTNELLFSFDQFVTGFLGILDRLCNWSSEFLKGVTILDVMNFILEFIRAMTLFSLAGAVGTISNTFDMINDAVEDMTGGQKHVKVRNFAIMLAILANSLKTLTEVPVEKLQEAIPVLVELAGIISGGTIVLNLANFFMGFKFKDVKIEFSSVLTIVAFAAALWIAVQALKDCVTIVQSLEGKPETAFKAIGLLIGIGVGLVVGLKKVADALKPESDLDEVVQSLASVLRATALLVGVMAFAVAFLGFLPPEVMYSGLFRLTLLLALITGFSAAMMVINAKISDITGSKNSGGDALKGLGVYFLGLAAVLAIMIPSILLLGAIGLINPGIIWSGLGFMALLLLEIGVLSSVILTVSKESKFDVSAGGGLALILVAFGILALILSAVSFIAILNPWGMLGTLGGLLAVMALFGYIIKKVAEVPNKGFNKEKIKFVRSFAISIAILAAVIIALGMFPAEAVARGFIFTAILMVVLNAIIGSFTTLAKRRGKMKAFVSTAGALILLLGFLFVAVTLFKLLEGIKLDPATVLSIAAACAIVIVAFGLLVTALDSSTGGFVKILWIFNIINALLALLTAPIEMISNLMKAFTTLFVAMGGVDYIDLESENPFAPFMALLTEFLRELALAAPQIGQQGADFATRFLASFIGSMIVNVPSFFRILWDTIFGKTDTAQEFDESSTGFVEGVKEGYDTLLNNGTQAAEETVEEYTSGNSKVGVPLPEMEIINESEFGDAATQYAEALGLNPEEFALDGEIVRAAFSQAGYDVENENGVLYPMGQSAMDSFLSGMGDYTPAVLDQSWLNVFDGFKTKWEEFKTTISTWGSTLFDTLMEAIGLGGEEPTLAEQAENFGGHYGDKAREGVLEVAKDESFASKFFTLMTTSFTAFTSGGGGDLIPIIGKFIFGGTDESGATIPGLTDSIGGFVGNLFGDLAKKLEEGDPEGNRLTTKLISGIAGVLNSPETEGETSSGIDFGGIINGLLGGIAGGLVSGLDGFTQIADNALGGIAGAFTDGSVDFSGLKASGEDSPIGKILGSLGGALGNAGTILTTLAGSIVTGIINNFTGNPEEGASFDSPVTKFLTKFGEAFSSDKFTELGNTIFTFLGAALGFSNPDGDPELTAKAKSFVTNGLQPAFEKLKTGANNVFKSLGTLIFKGVTGGMDPMDPNIPYEQKAQAFLTGLRGGYLMAIDTALDIGGLIFGAIAEGMGMDRETFDTEWANASSIITTLLDPMSWPGLIEEALANAKDAIETGLDEMWKSLLKWLGDNDLLNAFSSIMEWFGLDEISAAAQKEYEQQKWFEETGADLGGAMYRAYNKAMHPEAYELSSNIDKSLGGLVDEYGKATELFTEVKEQGDEVIESANDNAIEVDDRFGAFAGDDFFDVDARRQNWDTFVETLDKTFGGVQRAYDNTTIDRSAQHVIESLRNGTLTMDELIKARELLYDNLYGVDPTKHNSQYNQLSLIPWAVMFHGDVESYNEYIDKINGLFEENGLPTPVHSFIGDLKEDFGKEGYGSTLDSLLIEEGMSIDDFQTWYDELAKYATEHERLITEVFGTEGDIVANAYRLRKFYEDHADEFDLGELPDITDEGYASYEGGLIDEQALGDRIKQAMTTVGEQGGDGLVLGLDAKKGETTDAVVELAELIPEEVKEILGIASPSRVMKEIGVNAGEGLRLGIESTTPIILASISELAQNIIFMSNAFGEAGVRLISEFNTALTESSDTFRVGITIVTKAVSGIRTHSYQFYQVGLDCVRGFAQGFMSQSTLIKDAANRVAQEALDAAKKTVGVASPSKEFEKLGMWCDVGLANGLATYSKYVGDSSAIVGTTALESFRGYLSNVASLLNDEVNLNPTITPVLDVSQVAANAAYLNSMFGSRTMQMAGRAGSAFANSAYIQNGNALMSQYGGNTVDAINSLGDRIDTWAETMNNLQVVMDSGALVGQIATPLDTRLGVMATRRRRRI